DATTNAGVNNATIALSPGGLSTTTDSSGFYTMSVQPSTYTATATATGYGPAPVSGVIVTAGGSTTQDFTIGAPSTITGHVRDASTTAGIVSATITFSPGGLTTTTDGTGLYSKVVGGGTYSVTASASNYFSATATGVFAGS